MVPISPAGQLAYDRVLRGQVGTRVGDQQLAALLPVHGWIMRSGVLVLDGVFSADQIRRAAAALDYFGLAEAGQLLQRIPGADADANRIERLGRAYRGLLDMDLVLIAAFNDKHAHHPEDFEPAPTDAVASAGPEPDIEDPTTPIDCDQVMTIHQLGWTCADNMLCRWPDRYAYHQHRTLHLAGSCDLCPAGPDWAQ